MINRVTQPVLVKDKGFTLVELLIVVIILAILAAIVVPQFSAATDDAKASALDTSLSNMRTAIDLYYQQHGKYPGELTALGLACSGSTGAGALHTSVAFTEQMSLYTDVNGEACDTADAAFKYGPYLKKATLPTNPMTEVNTLNLVFAGTLGMTSSVTNGGWKYDTVTGQFIADHSAYDDR